MLLIISGPSAVGKSRLLSVAGEAFGFRPMVPVTTRLARETEIPGRDYEFVGKDSFRKLIRDDALTAWDYTLKNYYGYRKELGERVQGGENVVIHALARMGIRIARAYPNVILIFLHPSSDLLLDMRLSARNNNENDVLLRCMHREEELEHAPLFDIVIDKADVCDSSELAVALADIINRFS